MMIPSHMMEFSSPQHLDHNLNSELVSVECFQPDRELSRMSSSVSKIGKAFAIFYLPDRQTILQLYKTFLEETVQHLSSGPLCLVIMLLNPDRLRQLPFWNEVYENQLFWLMFLLLSQNLQSPISIRSRSY